MDEWRTFLYPLGFLSALAFGLRFLIQWIQSEKAHKSLVTRSFWQVSLGGNGLLFLHSFIQMQYPICLVQAINGVISWRNLNLMQNEKRISFKGTLILMVGALILTTIGFVFQDWLFNFKEGWFRIPVAPWQKEETSPLSFWWHLIGTVGYLLFSSRFWIQWILSEKKQISTLPSSFWWLSIVGAVFSIFYFIRIHDLVNLIGPLIGIIPYIRNLMLLKRTTAS